MKLLRPLLLSLAVAQCLWLSACRRKRPENPPAPVPPPTSPQPIPGTVTDQPKAGAPTPPITTEQMLQFEGRFGRPPTNYGELSRLKSEPVRR